MKKSFKDILTLTFVSGASIVLTNVYFMNNYLVYKIGDETTKDIFGNVNTYSEEDAEAAIRIFDAYENLKSGYVFGIESKELVDGAINGMAEATGDKHTTYTPRGNETDMATNRLSTNYHGIGVQISLQDGYPTVMGIFKDSPAEKVGLKTNDKIIKAGDTEYEGQELSEFVDKIKGEEGTFITLKIVRDGVEIERDVERKNIKRTTVSHEMKTKDIGYIDIDGFYDETASEFAIALNEVEKEKDLKTLIIDLRDNSGGYLNAAVKMSELFLKPNDIVLQQETKDTITKYYAENGVSDEKTYQIKILVNENSASSSEIFALALRENLKNVEIVGKETTGKGVVQKVEKMEDGAELKITIAKWLSPRGNWLEEGEIGIKPDREIDQHILYGLYGFSIKEGEEMERGMEDEMIRYIKAVFIEENDKLKMDDKFDEELEKEIKKMQKENKLEQTGFVGKEEIEIINKKIAKINEKLKDDQLEELIK